MTAVASSQLPTYKQTTNPENISNYNVPLGQPLAQSPWNPVNNTSLHHASLNQGNGRGRRPIEPTAGRPNSTNLALARSEPGQPDPPVQATNLESSDGRNTLVPRPTGQLLRAITDIGPRPQSPLSRRDVTEENWELRHGWEDEYNSSEYLRLLTSVSMRGFFGWMEIFAITEADNGDGRLSSCTIPTSATRPVGYQKMRTTATRHKNGG